MDYSIVISLLGLTVVAATSSLFLLQKYWQNIGNSYKIWVKTVIKKAEKGEKTRIKPHISGIFKIPPSPPFITNEAEMLFFYIYSVVSVHFRNTSKRNIGKILAICYNFCADVMPKGKKNSGFEVHPRVFFYSNVAAISAFRFCIR